MKTRDGRIPVKTQRNILAGLCALLLAAALLPGPGLALPSGSGIVLGQSSGPTEMHYVASKTGEKYHHLTCSYADRIKDANRIYYETAAQAEQDHRVPCAVCMS